MDFSRITPSIDVEAMQAGHITMVGGAYGLMSDLVRSGLGALTSIDLDVVDATNPARQDLTGVGRYKVEVAAAEYRRINPDVDLVALVRDFCAIGLEECEELFAHTDLFIFATDSFPAQARGNIVALHCRKPALWIGLYQGGRAGEIVFYVPGLACYRCICQTRYAAFPYGGTHVANTGGTILDVHLIDAIAGHLAVGILTRGAENRFGRLIDQLGSRNLLQVKLEPNYRLGDKDIFAQYLGQHPANFSFTTIALPMERDVDCPDCGHMSPQEHDEV